MSAQERIGDAFSRLGREGLLQGGGRLGAKVRAAEPSTLGRIASTVRASLAPMKGLQYQGPTAGQAAGLRLAMALDDETLTDEAVAFSDRMIDGAGTEAASLECDDFMTAYREGRRLPGRPTKEGGRRVPCQTKLSEAEHAAAVRAAEAAGQTLSEWVRAVVVAASSKRSGYG